MLRILLVAAFLGGIATTSASARMSESDYRQAMTAAAAMGQSAADFDACGADGSRFADLLNEILDKCNASSSQNAAVNQEFLDSKSARRRRINNEGGRCKWPRSEVREQLNDQLASVRAMTRSACR
jgi:hypothetical protein